MLSLPDAPEKDGSPLVAIDGAVLVHGDNVTGGEVPCLLTAAEPWVDVAFDYEDADAKTVTLAAQLYNSDDELVKDDVTVAVDGKEVTDVAVEAKGEGSFGIIVPRGDMTPDSVASVDVAPVEGVLGRQSDPAPVPEVMSALGDSATRDFDVKEIIISGGKSGLSALVQMGWQLMCKLYLDSTLSTSLYDVTSNELLAEIIKMQQQDACVSGAGRGPGRRRGYRRRRALRRRRLLLDREDRLRRAPCSRQDRRDPEHRRPEGAQAPAHRAQ